MTFSKLSAADFRPIRKRVMRQHKLGQGVPESRGCYVSTTSSGQIHSLSFGSPKWGGSLLVDVGVHFSCVPRFESAFWAQSHPHLPIECCFSTQVKTSDGSPGIAYGDSPAEAEKIVLWAADEAQRLLSTFETTWGDGRRILDEFPPDKMREDLERFRRLLAAPLSEQIRIDKSMHTRLLFPEWDTSLLSLSWLLGYLAIHFDRRELVMAYLEIARDPSLAHIARHYSVDLTSELQQAMQNRG